MPYNAYSSGTMDLNFSPHTKSWFQNPTHLPFYKQVDVLFCHPGPPSEPKNGYLPDGWYSLEISSAKVLPVFWRVLLYPKTGGYRWVLAYTRKNSERTFQHQSRASQGKLCGDCITQPIFSFSSVLLLHLLPIDINPKSPPSQTSYMVISASELASWGLHLVAISYRIPCSKPLTDLLLLTPRNHLNTKFGKINAHNPLRHYFWNPAMGHSQGNPLALILPS